MVMHFEGRESPDMGLFRKHVERRGRLGVLVHPFHEPEDRPGDRHDFKRELEKQLPKVTFPTMVLVGPSHHEAFRRWAKKLEKEKGLKAPLLVFKSKTDKHPIPVDGWKKFFDAAKGTEKVFFYGGKAMLVLKKGRFDLSAGCLKGVYNEFKARTDHKLVILPGLTYPVEGGGLNRPLIKK